MYKESIGIIELTKQYNGLVEKYNDLSRQYDESIKKCCVDNIAGIPLELGIINTKNEDFYNAIVVIFNSNSKEKIEKDIQTLHLLIEKGDQCYTIIKQMIAPTEEWIIDKLELVPIIKEMQSVTEWNNPDGLLNKEGGYIGCIYFTTNILDSSIVEGTDIVAKGTDAGGAIEIYAFIEDAESRCSYLAGFDGTILYSGSYAMVGTMVIRTSYMFSGEEQINLTNEIVKAITTVD